MNYQSFRDNLQRFVVFSVNDIRKSDPYFDNKALVYWQDKGYIKKIINRWYCFSDVSVNEDFLYLTANRIYSPSYISFETALSHYNLLPEGVYTIISASTLKTAVFKTEQGNFSYRHLKPSLFFGYHLIETGNHKIKIADLEKALLDYFYINEKISTDAGFEAMRINKESLLSQLNIKKLDAYLSSFSNKALAVRVNGFIQYINYA